VQPRRRLAEQRRAGGRGLDARRLPSLAAAGRSSNRREQRPIANADVGGTPPAGDTEPEPPPATPASGDVAAPARGDAAGPVANARLVATTVPVRASVLMALRGGGGDAPRAAAPAAAAVPSFYKDARKSR